MSIRYIFTIVICFDNVWVYILGFFQIQFCPRVKGACVYKYFSPSNPIYKPALCFDGVGIIFSYFLETNLVGARVYIVHFYHPLYALILIYKLWGACVYKYFSPPIPIYKSALYFDGVGVYILSFFPNTNLVGARVYIVHFYHLLYALILIYKLWGPVSKYFPPPNSIYKPAL